MNSAGVAPDSRKAGKDSDYDHRKRDRHILGVGDSRSQRDPERCVSAPGRAAVVPREQVSAVACWVAAERADGLDREVAVCTDTEDDARKAENSQGQNRKARGHALSEVCPTHCPRLICYGRFGRKRSGHGTSSWCSREADRWAHQCSRSLERGTADDKLGAARRDDTDGPHELTWAEGLIGQ